MVKGLLGVSYLLIDHYPFLGDLNLKKKVTSLFKMFQQSENIDPMIIERFFKLVVQKFESTFNNEVFACCFPMQDQKLLDAMKWITNFFVNSQLKVNEKLTIKVQGLIDYFFQNYLRYKENFEETFPNKKIYIILQDHGIKGLTY